MSDHRGLLDSWRPPPRGQRTSDRSRRPASSDIDRTLDERQRLGRAEIAEPNPIIPQRAYESTGTGYSSPSRSMLSTRAPNVTASTAKSRPSQRTPQHGSPLSGHDHASTFEENMLQTVTDILAASHNYNDGKDRLKVLEKTLETLKAELESQKKQPHKVFQTHLHDKISKAHDAVKAAKYDQDRARQQRDDEIRKSIRIISSSFPQDDHIITAITDSKLIDLECQLQQEREYRLDQRDQFTKRIKELEDGLANLSSKMTAPQMPRHAVAGKVQFPAGSEKFIMLEKRLKALEETMQKGTIRRDVQPEQDDAGRRSAASSNEQMTRLTTRCDQLENQAHATRENVHGSESKTAQRFLAQTVKMTSISREMDEQSKSIQSLSTRFDVIANREMQLSDPDRKAVNSILALAVDLNSVGAQISKMTEAADKNEQAISSLESKLSDFTKEGLQAEMSGVAHSHVSSLKDDVKGIQEELQRVCKDFDEIRLAKTTSTTNSMAWEAHFKSVTDRVIRTEATLATTQDDFTQLRQQLLELPRASEVKQLTDKVNEANRSIAESRTTLEDLQSELANLIPKIQENHTTCTINTGKVIADAQAGKEAIESRLASIEEQVKQQLTSQYQETSGDATGSTSVSEDAIGKLGAPGVLTTIRNGAFSRTKGSKTSKESHAKGRLTSKPTTNQEISAESSFVGMSEETGATVQRSEAEINPKSPGSALKSDTARLLSVFQTKPAEQQAEKAGSQTVDKVSQKVSNGSASKKRKHGEGDNVSFSDNAKKSTMSRSMKKKKKMTNKERNKLKGGRSALEEDSEIIVVDD